MHWTFNNLIEVAIFIHASSYVRLLIAAPLTCSKLGLDSGSIRACVDMPFFSEPQHLYSVEPMQQHAST